MPAFAAPGDFCLNKECPDYGKLQSTPGKKNIQKNGHTPRGRQRYRCLTCGETFTQSKGTIFYRRRVPDEEILKVLAMLAEGSRIGSVSRTTGHKEDTILAWLREASKHAQAIEEVLMADYEVTRGQLDALWSYVGHKGEKKAYPETPQQGTFWRATLLDMDTRLRVVRGMGKSEGEAAQEVFETLKGRGDIRRLLLRWCPMGGGTFPRPS